MKRILTTLLLFSVFALVGAAPVYAETQSLSVNTSVDFNEEHRASVTYTINGVNAVTQTEVTIPVVGRSIEELSAEVNDDTAGVRSETVESSSYKETAYTNAIVSLPSSVQGKDDSWGLILTYQTDDLYADFNKTQTIAIPAIELPGSDVDEAWQVSLPLEEGLPVAFGRDPDDSVVSGGRQTYTYEFEDQRNEAILLNFGTQSTYELTQHTKLENRGWWWKDFTVIVPPDTNQQTVAFDSISPKPDSIRLDRDGNILATYSVSPLKTVEVETKSTVRVRSLNYNTDGARPLTDIPDSFEMYLATEAPFADGQRFEADDSFALLEEIYNNAVNADLGSERLVADLRASGLPARLVEGQLLHNGGQALPEPVAHSWTEVYLPGSGWITLDSSVGQNYNQLGLIDAYHIAQAVNAEDYTRRGDITSTEINPVDSELPADAAMPAISQTKYVVLPGLSFTKTEVIMSEGIARDGLGYKDQDQVFRLGSLAPLQEVNLWSVSLAADSWTRNPIAVGQIDGEQLQNLSEDTATINFIPTLALLIILLGGGIIWTKWRRRRNKPIILSTGDEDDGTPADDLLSRKSSEDDS